jgi:hypothetical protein
VSVTRVGPPRVERHLRQGTHRQRTVAVFCLDVHYFWLQLDVVFSVMVAAMPDILISVIFNSCNAWLCGIRRVLNWTYFMNMNFCYNKTCP